MLLILNLSEKSFKYLKNMSILHKLKWRFAVKNINPEQEIKEAEITELLNTVRLSPSAMNIQPFDLIVVHNKSLQRELFQFSQQYPQVRDASHIFLFCVPEEFNDYRLQEYESVNFPQMSSGSVSARLDFFRAKLRQKEKDGLFQSWAKQQAYLAAGVLLVAAADLKIDASPIEMLDFQKYDCILELDKKGLSAVLAVCLGYRDSSEKQVLQEKKRRNLQSMVHLKY